MNRNETRWAIVAPTFSDARDTCIEGDSGVQAILNRYRMIHRYNRSLGEIELRNGSRIKVFSADEPNRLRGPQHHGAWCDELAAWRYSEAFDQLRMGLRLGEHPQIVATTTPRPRKFLKQIMDRPGTHITRGSTFDNKENLSGSALEEFKHLYEGTRLGRQELYGEFLEDNPGALWTMKGLDETRVKEAPELERIVVGVDPATTSGEDSDSTGIITVGKGRDGHYYILADHTLKASPDQWARQAAIAYYGAEADHIIVETNQGGDMSRSILQTVDPDLPIKGVHARQGKRIRAEPVAALSEQGKLHMVGFHSDLEEELTSWSSDSKDSPDRLDAMVHAVTGLMQGRTLQPVQLMST